MIHYRGSVHLSWLVDSDILLHLVGRVSLLSGRDWFGVRYSDSLVGTLCVYLEGEGGGGGEGRGGEGEGMGRGGGLMVSPSYTGPLWKEFSPSWLRSLFETNP